MLHQPPDGEKIALYANLESNTDICIVDIEADDYFCLEEDDYIENLPSWSFDGAQLLFSAYNRESETHEIFQIDLDGTNKSKITTNGEFYNPIWLLSGFFISTDLNEAGQQLWILTIDGSWQQQLTFDSGGVRFLMISYP
jgi:Tol biopolymer transport system component